MTNSLSKISSGLFDSITQIVSTKEGLTIFFLVLSIALLILWLTNLIKKFGGTLTLVSFITTFFMAWITWATCDC